MARAALYVTPKWAVPDRYLVARVFPPWTHSRQIRTRFWLRIASHGNLSEAPITWTSYMDLSIRALERFHFSRRDVPSMSSRCAFG